MLGWLFMFAAFGGGGGCLFMANESRKLLGVIPMLLWTVGFMGPSLGIVDFITILVLQGSAAVLGVVFFNMARMDRVKRALEDDD